MSFVRLFVLVALVIVVVASAALLAAPATLRPRFLPAAIF